MFGTHSALVSEEILEHGGLRSYKKHRTESNSTSERFWDGNGLSDRILTSPGQSLEEEMILKRRIRYKVGDCRPDNCSQK